MKQIAILVAMLFVLTGCNTNKRRNIVILVDNSASITEDIIQRYIATIQNTILPNMGEKDKLTLQFIDGCSQGKAERIFTVDLAEVNFENDADGINHKADSSNMRRMIYMAGVTDKLAAQVVNKRRERKDCGQYTDIINAIIEAKTLVENGKSYSNATNQVVNNISGAENYVYETCLIIFSDMVDPIEAELYIVEPNNCNERLNRQQGLFVIPSNIQSSFEENILSLVNEKQILSVPIKDIIKYSNSRSGVYSQSDILLMKINIHKHLNLEITKILKQMNISAETLYPGLEGLAKSVSCLRDAMGDYRH